MKIFTGDTYETMSGQAADDILTLTEASGTLSFVRLQVIRQKVYTKN